MTCREKLKIERPDYVHPTYNGGCRGCPNHYEFLRYLSEPDYCLSRKEPMTIKELNNICQKCWDREIEEEIKNGT